jgi:hypothetical protein
VPQQIPLPLLNRLFTVDLLLQSKFSQNGHSLTQLTVPVGLQKLNFLIGLQTLINSRFDGAMQNT